MAEVDFVEKIKGIIWLFLSKFFPPIINFFVFSYAARILEPEDFGVVAMVQGVVFLCSCFLPTGWREGLIKFDNIERLHFSSVLWLNVLVASILIFFCWGGSYFIDTPNDYFPIALRITSFCILFDGMAGVANAVILRQQRYRIIAIRTVFSSLLSAAVILTLLRAGMGIQALILSQVILSIFNFGLLCFSVRKEFGFMFSVSVIKHMGSFGWYTTLTEGVSQGKNQIEILITGTLLGNRELGFFNTGKRFIQIVNDICIGTINQVNFPLLASRQNDLILLRKGFLNSIYLSALLLFPLYTFLMIEAEKIIEIIFTEKWLSSVIVFQFFCAMSLFIVLGVPQKTIVFIFNKSRSWFRLQILLLSIILPLTAFAATFNISSVLSVMLISTVVFTVSSFIKSLTLLELSKAAYIDSIKSVIVFCMFIGGILWLRPWLFVNNVIIELALDALIILFLYFIFIVRYQFQRLELIFLSISPSQTNLVNRIKSNFAINLISKS